MASWADAPPTKEELSTVTKKASWMDKPPSEDELRPMTNISQVDAIKTLGGRDFTFGLSPFAAGVGAALGAASGTKGDIYDKYNAAEKAYSQGKTERKNLEQETEKEYPKTAMATNVGGLLATAPIVGAGSIPGAIAKGAAVGGAYGLGQGEGMDDIEKGAAFGGVGGGLFQAATPYAGKALGFVGRGAAKVGSALSGLPENEIKNYAAKTPIINKLIGKGDILDQVEAQRQGLLNDVNTYRKAQNSQIGEILNSNESKQMAPGQTLTDLLAFKSKLDPKLQPELINQVDNLVNKYVSAVGENGSVSPQQMNIIRGELQDIANSGGAYKNSQGALIGYSSELGSAAKQAARTAREGINQEIPELAQPYKNLSNLYSAQSRLGGLLGEKGNPTSLLNAAGGETSKSKWLNYLGDKVGSKSLDELKNLKTAQTFANPDLLSQFKTGRSLTGMAVGGLAGGLLDPEDRKTGALIGSAIASPLAIKGLINAGNLGRVVGKPIINALKTDVAPSFIKELPEASSVLNNEVGAIGNNVGEPNLLDRVKDANRSMEVGYGKGSNATQEDINKAASTLKDLRDAILSRPDADTRFLKNKYEQLREELGYQVRRSPNSKFAQDTEFRDRNAPLQEFPRRYELGDHGAEIVNPEFGSKPSEPNSGPGEVIPYQDRFARTADRFKQKGLASLRSSLDTFGKPVNVDDAFQARTGLANRDSLFDKDLSKSAAQKYADMKNIEKAKGGEFASNPGMLKYSSAESAYKDALNSRTRALKQLNQNQADLSEMASQISQMGSKAPKEMVDLYRELAQQHFDAAKELKAKGYRLPSPESLVGGEVIPAEEAFKMWGGRPTPEGPKGLLIDRSLGLDKPIDYNFSQELENNRMSQPEPTGNPQKPGLLIPENKFMEKLLNTRPSPENERIQKLLDIYAKSPGQKGLLDVRRAMENTHARANHGVVGRIGPRE